MIYYSEMDTFFEAAKNFKSKRDAYHQKHDELLEQRKADKASRIKEIMTVKSDTGLTKDELIAISESLEAEYEKNHVGFIWDEEHPGVPSAITIPIERIVNESFDLANGEKYGNGYSEDTWDKDMTPKGTTAAQNYRAAYLLCIDILNSHGVQVTEVMRDPTKFENFRRSTCAENGNSFMFKCRKNNYTFNAEYDDDCDCYPGIFRVKDIIQISPEIKIGSGDLRLEKHSDKMPVENKNFVTLLNSPNYDTYVQTRFGHLLRLPGLLRSKGIEVVYSEPLISPNHHHLNDHFNYTYVLTIKTSNDEFDIVLNDGHDGEYYLYFNETLHQQNEINKQNDGKYYYEKKKYDWNVFHHAKQIHRMKVKYQSDDDFNNLLNCINIYHNWKTGAYGYWENDQFYNEKHITAFQNFSLKGADSTHENFYKYEFNVYGQSYGDHSWPVVYHKYHVEDAEYPMDDYGITFYYDSADDPDNCVVTIEGKWYDATPISNKYYQDNEVFVKSTVTIKDIAPTFVFRGKYSECIAKLKEFDQQMAEINPNERNKKLKEIDFLGE